MEHDSLGDALRCVASQPSPTPPDHPPPEPEQHHAQAPRPCRTLAPLLHLPEWEEESGDRLYDKANLLALRGWLRRGGWSPELPDPVPSAPGIEPLPSNGATPAVVTVAAATGRGDPQPRVEGSAVCLSLRLDVDPWTAEVLLLRLCPRARAVSCLCLMAGPGGHD